MTQLTPKEIAILNEFCEAEAWANYCLQAPATCKDQLKVEVKQVGSIWVSMVSALDWAFFNRIVGLGMKEDATESMLDDAIGILQNAGCTNYMAQICPQAQPAGQIPEWLSQRGLLKSRNWAKLYRGNEAAPVVSTSLRVESIGEEFSDAFSEIVLKAFEMPDELKCLIGAPIGKPGWSGYLAFDGKEPVSAAAMFISGETCWLGFGSTLETHRNRGGQGALFARRIADGLKLGCKWFVTEAAEDTPESPNPSYHNMLRTGFKLAYQRPNYVHQGKPN